MWGPLVVVFSFCQEKIMTNQKQLNKSDNAENIYIYIINMYIYIYIHTHNQKNMKIEALV